MKQKETNGLRTWSNSDPFVGRVTRLVNEGRSGLITAYRTDGTKWKYADGTVVDDITLQNLGTYSLRDWVVVREYDVLGGKGGTLDQRPEIRALTVDRLERIGRLEDLLPQDVALRTKRFFTGAISHLYPVGQRILILASFLENERHRLGKSLDDERDQLRNKECDLDARLEDLAVRASELEEQSNEVERDRQAVLEAKQAFNRQLARLNLSIEDVADGAVEQRVADFVLSRPEVQDFIQKGLEDRLADEREKLQQEKEQLVADRQELRANRKQLEEDSRRRQRQLEEREQELSRYQEKLEQEVNRLAGDREKLRADRKRLEKKNQQHEVSLDRRERELSKKEEALSKREAELEEGGTALTRSRGESFHARSSRARNEPNEELPEIVEWESEEELISHVKDYISGRSYHYDDPIVEMFYTCLKANYLTVLSGMSGTGKSTLPALFAKAIGARFELIPVRPNWHDDRDLLGFFNFQENRYESTQFLDALIRAEQEPDRLHFVCLDEMNLAPVEHYFSTFLSLLERCRDGDHGVAFCPDMHLTAAAKERVELDLIAAGSQLLSEQDAAEIDDPSIIEKQAEALQRKIDDLDRYSDVCIPTNLRFVGTVNIDHTTQGFSDKVVDRVNVIQFEAADLDVELRSTDVSGIGLSYHEFELFGDPSLDMRQLEVVKDYVKEIRNINVILTPAGVGFGFRVLRDIERFMRLAVGAEYLDCKTAFDLEIKQRILPKIRGMESRALAQALEGLRDFLEEHGYENSYQKVAGPTGMLQQLRTRGYVNYWETH